jgi:hypothetical protein
MYKCPTDRKLHRIRLVHIVLAKGADSNAQCRTRLQPSCELGVRMIISCMHCTYANSAPPIQFPSPRWHSVWTQNPPCPAPECRSTTTRTISISDNDFGNAETVKSQQAERERLGITWNGRERPRAATLRNTYAETCRDELLMLYGISHPSLENTIQRSTRSNIKGGNIKDGEESEMWLKLKMG